MFFILFFIAHVWPLNRQPSKPEVTICSVCDAKSKIKKNIFQIGICLFFVRRYRDRIVQHFTPISMIVIRYQKLEVEFLLILLLK